MPKLPGILGWLSSPAKSVAAVVDAVIERIRTKWAIHIAIVEGGFRVSIDDIAPDDKAEMPN